MNSSYIIIIVAVAVVIIVVYFMWNSRDDGTIPKAKQSELDSAIAEWGVEKPEGNMYISIQKETAVGMMAESPDQLTSYRAAIPHEWKLLAKNEIIKNEVFSVRGADMKTEYCQWERPDGKFNVICLCYNLLIVFMVVDNPVVEKMN